MIYLDHAATTPLLDCAFQAMLPWLRGELCGNPSSIHAAGRSARRAVEEARECVAALIGADPEEIIFTSGGTEADNLALQGVAGSEWGSLFLVSEVEHPAVLHQAERLCNRHWIDTAYLTVDENGRVLPDCLRWMLNSNRRASRLVSVLAANNETGAVQPLAEIGEICKECGVLFHTDAVQAAGHMEIRVKELGIHALSLSAHKFGGPDGVGALYTSRQVRDLMEPMLFGGGQERGKRAGTENVAGIVGFGAAAKWTVEHMEEQREKYDGFKRLFLDIVMNGVSDAVQVNGGGEVLPNILNLTIPGVQSEALLLMLDMDGVCISAASACSSGSPKHSHVLSAMGLDEESAASSVRISFGHSNTAEEVQDAATRLVKCANRIRAMYEHREDGYAETV